jgi:hypothetical protein
MEDVVGGGSVQGGHAASAVFVAERSYSWMEPQNRHTETLRTTKRLAINAFLVFHLVAITCWCIPLSTPLIVAFRTAVRPYFLWSGLFQSWDAFAPEPKHVNAYVEAVVIHHNGAIQTWKFPRMEQLSLVERTYRERYRKFVENLQADANAPLWPDVSRRIARLTNNAPNPPEIIMLVRHWTDIVPRAGASASREPSHVQILYEYKVTPRDLE